MNLWLLLKDYSVDTTQGKTVVGGSIGKFGGELPEPKELYHEK